MKVIEHGFDEIIKADLELTDTNEDLIKKGMFSRKKIEGLKIRRRRTALSRFCPDLLCGFCQSKSEIFSREGFRVSGFRI